MRVPFNWPTTIGKELEYIQQALANHHLSGNGPFTKKCQAWMEDWLGCSKALLTHSGTAALEMAAILIGIEPGDEVLCPSYTFPSTANAFVIRGAVPVFVDIRPDTLNIDESAVESAVTERTKAIVAVHYAGVACEMDILLEVARRHRLALVEDAAQGFLSTYRGRFVGSFGDFAAASFHETKNVSSGEGGALFINAPSQAARAEIVWEKGTNRGQFYRGETSSYTWLDVGSSYLPSEITAAFLWGQLERAHEVCRKRREIWHRYHELFVDLERAGKIRRPVVPAECQHNGHLYYVVLRGLEERKDVLEGLQAEGIGALFHYVPLHSSPAGRRFGRIHGSMSTTEEISRRLIRLPLWFGMTEEDVRYVCRALYKALRITPPDALESRAYVLPSVTHS